MNTLPIELHMEIRDKITDPIDHIKFCKATNIPVNINFISKTISECPEVPEDIAREYSQFVDWNFISSVDYQLSYEFIREFQDKVNWLWISHLQKLSEEFIREFQHKVNWYYISFKQLSEDFIREFQDKVDWRIISFKQKQLSAEFLREFKDKVDWEIILWKQQQSEEVKESLLQDEFEDKINFLMRRHFCCNWRAFINLLMKLLNNEFV